MVSQNKLELTSRVAHRTVDRIVISKLFSSLKINMSEEQDQYEHYNYDPPVSGGSGASGKGRSKQEVGEKMKANEQKTHATKDARKAAEQITNAEQKQKEKNMKKQNSKD